MTTSDQELLEKLNINSATRERVSEVLLAAEDETGDATKANDVEMQTIQESNSWGTNRLPHGRQRQALRTTETLPSGHSLTQGKNLLTHDIQCRDLGQAPAAYPKPAASPVRPKQADQLSRYFKALDEVRRYFISAI